MDYNDQIELAFILSGLGEDHRESFLEGFIAGVELCRQTVIDLRANYSSHNIHNNPS